MKVLFMQSLAKIGAWTKSMYSHFPHISARSFCVDDQVVFFLQYLGHFPIAVLGMLSVYFVNQSLDGQFFRADWDRTVIEACSVDIQELGLTTY